MGAFLVRFAWPVLTSKAGRTVALALAVVLLGLGWRAYERHDAVVQERARQEQRDAAAVRKRDERSREIRTDTDAALIDRLAGPR